MAQRRTSSHGDISPSNHLRYTKPAGSFELKSNNRPQNYRGFPKPMFNSRATQPLDTCSTSPSLLKQEVKSNPPKFSCNFYYYVFTRRCAKGNLETHKRHKHQKIAKAFPYNVYKGSFSRQDVLIKHTRLRYPPILPN